MGKTLWIALLILMSCATCFGQSSYKGLTPGQSTRAEVERVFGQPQKKISPTLAEYAGGAETTKVYVQFADDTRTAQVLRIELYCEAGKIDNPRRGCVELRDKLIPEYPDGNQDARLDLQPDNPKKYSLNYVRYYGAPAYVVSKFRDTTKYSDTGPGDGTGFVQFHLGLYSKELYESAVPKGCTGTFAGVFDSNRGRMTLRRIPKTKDPETGDVTNIKGSYSTDSGTITALEFYARQLSGEWKDATGSGTFWLEPSVSGLRVTFSGKWNRKTGKGPKSGDWEGRCVEAN